MTVRKANISYFQNYAEVTTETVKNINNSFSRSNAPFEIKLVPLEEHPNYQDWKEFFDIYFVDGL
ncbi:hypothetical protein BC952_2585 [Flavobacterium limicola]|uniref:Uncharacterized protein n=1 Tax=Flavobacterium limicola TaxID=180441 RepID=A0A495RZ08_9FLAO|nr:hypothetical protein BC952_2585 [Flavobacterium limicola]